MFQRMRSGVAWEIMLNFRNIAPEWQNYIWLHACDPEMSEATAREEPREGWLENSMPE